MKLQMPLLRILPFLLCLTSFAQVNIIIEDESKTGFLLGVNGYVQNTEPVSLLMIKGLDTVPTQLLVELQPRVYFTKIIDLHEKGNYKYVVTTNSRDELQLRYRGTLSKIPEGILAMEVQRVLAMEQKEPIITASVKSDQAEIVPQLSSPTPAPVIPTKEIIHTKKVDSIATAKPKPVVIKIDTAQNQNKVVAIKPASKPKDTVVIKVNPFDAFITDLSKTEFEFEKLQKSEAYAKNHNFTLEELKQVFNILSYDNSRLTLVRSVKGSFKDVSQMKVLAEELDYEISKAQLEEILKS